MLAEILHACGAHAALHAYYIENDRDGTGTGVG